MKKTLVLFAAAMSLTWAAAFAPAQELLINGNLDDPGIHESDIAVGWTLTKSPDGVNAATFASFANHTPAPDPPVVPAPPQVGLWYRAFEGTTFQDPRPAVNADLTQTVAHVPGLNLYTLTGWARFEANYTGGLEFLPSGGTIDPPAPPRWPENTPSPTRTEFAIEFLDIVGSVLPGSVVVDLRDDLGQTNDNQWHQHTISAFAPAGTVNVQVRASMIDGVNADLNPQSAFVDDFSLTRVIPEPNSMLLAGMAMLGLMVRRQRIA